MHPVLFNVLYFLLTLYCSTWRYKYHSTGDYEKEREAGRTSVLPCWHNQMLALSFYWKGKKRIANMSSLSKDGELMSTVLNRWGFVAARGSSNRGGARAIIEMKKIMQTMDRDANLTLDGPTGPKYESKPGAVVLAKLVGCKIIPGFCTVSRYIQLKTWDRLIIPLPFAKIDFYLTEAIEVDNDRSEEAVARDTEMLNEIMNRRRREICPDFL